MLCTIMNFARIQSRIVLGQAQERHALAGEIVRAAEDTRCLTVWPAMSSMVRFLTALTTVLSTVAAGTWGKYRPTSPGSGKPVGIRCAAVVAS